MNQTNTERFSNQCNHRLQTTAAHRFRTRLVFKQYDVNMISTKEESALQKKKVYLKEKICKDNTMCQVIGLIHIFVNIN